MGDVQHREENRLQCHDAPGSCDYCGAPLARQFYFCPACSKPCQSIEAVLPARRPVTLSDEARIALHAPQVWPVALGFTAIVLFVSVVPAMLFTDRRPDLAMFLATLGVTVATAVFAGIYWRTLAEQVGRWGFGHIAAWAGLALLIPLLMLNVGWHALMELIFPWGEADEFTLLRNEGVSITAMVIMFCLVPAVTEEIAFRGLIQHWLHAAIAPMHAVVLSSALFAGAHVWAWFAIWSLPYLFLTGLLLGWVKWRTGSLYPCMVIHLLHNAAIVALALATQ